MLLDAPVPDTLQLPPAPGQTTLAVVLDERMLFDAWERVRSNDGCAGIDTQSIDEFASGLLGNLQRLKAEVERREYRPQPLQALRIPKPAGGFRTLAIPSVRDRVLQTAVARTLGPSLDRNFSDSSFAYRPGRSVAMAVQRVVAHRDAGLRYVVDADIESFFDQIDHHLLIETLVRAHPVAEDLIALIQQWLAADLRESGPAPGRLLDRGLPQGSPLSPLLANLYLDKLDRTLKLHGLAFVRYADDLVVLCATAGAARGALLQLRLALAERRLTLNERKTRLTDFDTGFQFLGMRFVHRLVEPLTTAEPPEFDVTHLARQAVRGSAAHTKPAKAAPRILESIDPASTASEDEASTATARADHPEGCAAALAAADPLCRRTRRAGDQGA
jgi:CRISPR-associated protein Cas1